MLRPWGFRCAGASLPEVECYPRPIMAWTERFYGTVFAPHGDFALRGHGRTWLLCSPSRRLPLFSFFTQDCTCCKFVRPVRNELPPDCSDYIFGDRKFGGNAQAITRQRWLHHTSFLWDFRDDRMALLQHPEKAPEYRAVCHEFIIHCVLIVPC